MDRISLERLIGDELKYSYIKELERFFSWDGDKLVRKELLLKMLRGEIQYSKFDESWYRSNTSFRQNIKLVLMAIVTSFKFVGSSELFPFKDIERTERPAEEIMAELEDRIINKKEITGDEGLDKWVIHLFHKELNCIYDILERDNSYRKMKAEIV